MISTCINVYLLYGSQSTVVRNGGERKRSKSEIDDILLVMAAAKLKQREMFTSVEALWVGRRKREMSPYIYRLFFRSVTYICVLSASE